MPMKDPPVGRGTPICCRPSFQARVAIVVGARLHPETGTPTRPFGDGPIGQTRKIPAPVVFCTTRRAIRPAAGHAGWPAR